jgi:hypothetical protein
MRWWSANPYRMGDGELNLISSESVHPHQVIKKLKKVTIEIDRKVNDKTQGTCVKGSVKLSPDKRHGYRVWLM